jgi:hypothetical protein
MWECGIFLGLRPSLQWFPFGDGCSWVPGQSQCLDDVQWLSMYLCTLADTNSALPLCAAVTSLKPTPFAPLCAPGATLQGLLPGQVLFTVSMYLEDCGPTEVLRFVGGRPEFGAWSPEAAPLCTAPRTRTANGRRIGVWEARVPLWPGYYQYKPVVLDTATGAGEGGWWWAGLAEICTLV